MDRFVHLGRGRRTQDLGLYSRHQKVGSKNPLDPGRGWLTYRIQPPNHPNFHWPVHLRGRTSDSGITHRLRWPEQHSNGHTPNTQEKNITNSMPSSVSLLRSLCYERPEKKIQSFLGNILEGKSRSRRVQNEPTVCPTHHALIFQCPLKNHPFEIANNSLKICKCEV